MIKVTNVTGVTKSLTEAIQSIHQKTVQHEEAVKKLSPKQQEIAAVAGDPDKIDAEDFRVLRARKDRRPRVRVHPKHKMPASKMHEDKVPGVVKGSLEGDLHLCATKIFHEEYGEGTPIYSQHAEPDSEGNIAWYNVEFRDVIVQGLPVEEMVVLQTESHMNHKSSRKKMKEEVEDIEEDVEQIDELKDETLRKYMRGARKDISRRTAAGVTPEKSPKLEKRIKGYRKAWAKVSEETESDEKKNGEGLDDLVKQNRATPMHRGFFKVVDPNASLLKRIVHVTKFADSAQRHAEKVLKQGKSVTIEIHDHKGKYGSVDVKPGEDVEAKLDKLKTTADGVKEEAQLVDEKHLTPAEMRKREEIAKAMEREHPGMPMSKKMAIATAAAKRVAEGVEEVEESKKTYSAKAARAGKDLGEPGKNFEKIARSAAKRYGSKKAGERVAGAILAKIRAKGK